ncbi:hypothetical protein [Streptomyces sp. NPDC056628]|uniref:hypothetical protein n=1 Tax=Streptomyces sp. NPDC056628 TaxID=3345882 RepID=UPI00367A19DF
MPRSARLVVSLDAPSPSTGFDTAPCLTSGPASRLLVQRDDAELIVRELAGWAPVSTIRFPAPWPRGFGSWAVSPAADLAVFAGRHGLRAVDRAGHVRWELRHRCWAGCAGHTDVAGYADDRDHRYSDSGSVAFAADGKLVWAHVRGPSADADTGQDGAEEWLVLDAADGTVLDRAATGTAAAGSVHVPHPDPGQMGLSIGEGQDGAPLRWGRWDGRRLAVDAFGGADRVLLAVSPSGDRLLTVTHDQDTLAVHRTADGSVTATLDADAVPPHPAAEEDTEDDETRAYFDYEGGFVDEDTLVVGTAESDEEFGPGRHWLVDPASMRLLDRLAYPVEVSGPPRALGDGTWYTVSAAGGALLVWAL